MLNDIGLNYAQALLLTIPVMAFLFLWFWRRLAQKRAKKFTQQQDIHYFDKQLNKQRLKIALCAGAFFALVIIAILKAFGIGPT